MRITMKTGLWVMVGLLVLSQLALPSVVANDLKALRIPSFENKDGFAIGITEYSLETNAELLGGKKPEHSVELSALLQPAEREDVLCFSSTLVAKSAEDSRGRDILRPQRKNSRAKKFNALMPSLEYKDRQGEALLLCESELDAVELDRPGTEVAELVVAATTIIVKKRKSEEIAAEVADRYTDIGSGSSVQVGSMEIDNKGEMTVKLNIKHTGNKDIPVIDAVYALDKRGKRMGGGRWTNELELFAKSYDVELNFLLQGEDVDKLEVVLATDYEVEEVEFVIDELFQD